MSTTSKLGISVYTELGRTGGPPPPKNWWDLDGILGLGLATSQNSLETYFAKVLSLRIPSGKHDVGKRLKDLAKDKMQDVFFASVFLDPSAASIGGNNLPPEKSAGTVAQLTELDTSGSYADAVTQALQCTDAGCKAYQEAILDLLKDRSDVRLNAYRNTSPVKLKEYGQDVMKEKVKFYTKLRMSDSRPQIEVLFASEKYKNSSSHARHVEILSGILFEAGNVYCGNYIKPTKKKETEVFVHNARQVLGIARSHPVTQTDWRNVMTLLLATDVNVTTFKCTQMAFEAFAGADHDVSSKMKVGYT